MSKITGKETKPEVLVRRYLFAKGFRFRKNDIRLPGKPDIVLPKYAVLVFVNGCFWHGHNGCKRASLPKTNSSFWGAKIARNKERDKKTTQALKKLGWHIMVIWQCEVQNTAKAEKTCGELAVKISSYK
jgi:DNA mismatch endonuclease (patch repair protein)